MDPGMPMNISSGKDIWSQNHKILFTSFWNWTPDTWAVVGWTKESWRENKLNKLTDPFITAIYITKSACRKNRETDPSLQGMIVGFYLVSKLQGHRNKFSSLIHHDRGKGKWEYAVLAKHAFTYQPEYRPTVDSFIPNLKDNARHIASQGMIIENREQIKTLRNTPYEEVKCFSPE